MIALFCDRLMKNQSSTYLRRNYGPALLGDEEKKVEHERLVDYSFQKPGVFYFFFHVIFK